MVDMHRQSVFLHVIGIQIIELRLLVGRKLFFLIFCQTVSLAESVTGKIVGETESEVSIDTIVKTVCEYFNITRDTLLSKTRKRQIVQARQIAMYECRNLIPNCSLSTIGSELGGKDHATVLHACSTVQDLMSTDRGFRQWVSDIEGMIVVPVEA